MTNFMQSTPPPPRKLLLARCIPRCHASSCPERTTCLRWLDRFVGDIHAPSLNNDNGTCTAKLPLSLRAA